MHISQAAPTARRVVDGSCRTADIRTPAVKPISCWLLLVLYPSLLPLGTYPVRVGANWVSAEFLFSIFCVLAVAVDAGTRKWSVTAPNLAFVLGLALWLSANLTSAILHPEVGGGMITFRLGLKALFGCLVFVVLMNTGRLDWLLKSYLAGCALAGVAAIAFSIQADSLVAFRQASYAGLNPEELDVDVFRGLARAGAGNLLPLWICVVLGLVEHTERKRTVFVVLGLCFGLLAMLPLRREVLVEFVIGSIVVFFVVPRRRRVTVVAVALIVATVMAVFVAKSESWQVRLDSETRREFEAGSNPRTVLLLSTPAELSQAPLLGHGPGSYPWTMSKYFDLPGALMPKGIAAHNSFSRAAVETGAVGLLGFTLMVSGIGRRAVRSRTKGTLRLLAAMIFLHVGGWMSFGDGIASNATWFFIGVLLYFDRALSGKHLTVVGFSRVRPRRGQPLGAHDERLAPPRHHHGET